MLADLRAAWRTLRRSPGYLAAAVLTLALGVGATTALFGVVDRVLLRPLPYRAPERIVRIWDRGMADGLVDLVRARGRSYADVAAFGYPGDVTVLAPGVAGRPEPVRVPLQAALVGGVRTTLVLLFGGVTVMLVVAAVNATGLALVRAAGRGRELTVRAAVGAARARLVAQLVAEGVVVAGFAAALGAALAWALTRALAAALPPALGGEVPGAGVLGVDGRALFFTCLVALAATALPARRAARIDPLVAIRAE